jgi:formate dehydrogenase iron-sulfur subunit
MSGVQTTLSRRQFLKLGTAGVIASGFASSCPAGASEELPASEDAWGILIDLTRCTGCDSCALACRAENGLSDADEPPRQLDNQAYTFVERRETAGGDQFIKHQCMHCLSPACVSACTVGALQKTAAGPVVYDADKCIGCRYCQYACPFGVPSYDWSNPLGLIHKCQMCIDRLAADQPPACVAACSSGALRFGTRKMLLAQARAQIVSNPGRYVNHIYGEHEAGGTSVLYLSGMPFADLGFPELGDEPIPHEAEAVMRKTPVVALTVAAVATSLYWLTKRRNEKLSIPVASGEVPGSEAETVQSGQLGGDDDR